MADLPQTLYAQLRDGLRAQILQGKLAPGARLPSEAELSASHGVSRITVRQALADLQIAGLIVKLQGKGAFVAPPRADLARLEGLGEALAPQGQVHSRRLSLRIVKASAQVARVLGIKPGAELTQLVSLRYLERSPLSMNTSHFAPGLGERIARIDVSGRDLLEVLERDLAQPVREAQVEVRSEALGAKEAKWLHAEAGTPALRVDRTVLAEGARPLQLESAIYPGDRFIYRMTQRR